MPFLKKYMADANASGNYNFYFDRRGDRVLYNTYIVGGAPQPIKLSPDLRSELNQLATAKDWAGMAQVMNQARIENQATINNEILPGFQQSPDYQKFQQSAKPQSMFTRLAGAISQGTRREPPAIGPQLPAQMQQTRRIAATLEQAIDRYSVFFVNGKKTITTMGLPEDARARERLFREGQQRHARVVAIFTRRYTADKSFRKDSYGPFFAKLQSFTRLWVEYKALLHR